MQVENCLRLAGMRETIEHLMRLSNSRKRPHDDDGYAPSVAAADVEADRCTAAKVLGTPILLTRHQGRLYAFYRYCPHASGDLSKGSVYRGRVDCPDHGYRFELAGGRILWPEDESYCLRLYPTKEVDGIVWVKV